MQAIQAFLYQLAVSFDLPILEWIQAYLQSDFLDTVMPIITLFGEGGIFWIAWAVSMGKRSSSSISSAKGLTSFSANSRYILRSINCSFDR